MRLDLAQRPSSSSAGLDLAVVSREFTLVGVNPALDAFRDVADDLRLAAEEAARSHGRSLRSQLQAA